MKSDTVFKRAYNEALDLLDALGETLRLPSESEFASTLGVSRTTVRKVLARLAEQRIIDGGAGRWQRRRSASTAPRYPDAETTPRAEYVERQFLEWMLRDNAIPGSVINELELARRFGVATTGIREFLNRFQRFGLIEKRPNSGWVFKGFTPAFALELFEIREMFEPRSARAFLALSPEAAQWRHLRVLRDEHVALLQNIEERYHDFSDLDSRFHRLVNSASPNRFIDGFYDLITLIFHYHYQWNKRDERLRNEVAAREHLAYIDALLDRDRAATATACRIHLDSARTSLLRATSGMP